MTNFKQSPATKASLAVAGGDAFVRAVEGIFFGFGAEKGESGKPPVWGILPPSALTAERCRHWIELIEEGCSGFIVVDDREKDKVWADVFLSHRFLAPYLGRIPQAKNLSELCAHLASEPAILPLGSLRRYVEAIRLQESIKGFSHGSDGDVVNGFLAPARLLPSNKLEDHKTAWKGNWDKFVGVVLAEKTELSELKSELAESCLPITNWCDGTNGSLETDDLERVMMLLTQIRTLADQKSREDSNSPQPKPLKSLGAPGAFKLLVVDDHAESWHPVFASLLEELEGRLSANIEIRFSCDGESMADTKERVLFGSYDLVLLDIFLGNLSGTEILKRLRRDFSQLPVLLWTTSRDEEITGAARLANGILLKKTVTRDNLVESLYEWLVRGQAIRSKTLPNPFFHHTIQSADLRGLAVDFHEWCLKQLDSFHALDASFFRYFTDHGGRHIVKLWELLEHALQGFLGDEDDNLLLPANPKKREIEILALYLAVICHELGMFPMKVGKRVEDFSALPPEYLRDVRSLHAVRGMVMIADKEGKHWNDARGKVLGNRLHEKHFDDVAHRLAALVGYHARVFKSLASEAFLEWEGQPEGGTSPATDLEDRIGKLESNSANLNRGSEPFQKAFSDTADAIPAGDIRERLRKQCALFRFVDALDVSYTRNPAEFLSVGGKLPLAQYRENLKREVCESAKIEGGMVKVTMRVKAPTLKRIRAITSHLITNKIGDLELNVKAKKLLSTRNSKVIKRPWEPNGFQEWAPDAITNDSSFVLHKPLDKWLERVWEVVVKGNGNTEFIEHLRELDVLDAKAQDPVLTRIGAEIIASVTALSVAGELLDEYRAIAEADLQDKIRLTGEGWNWHDKPWGPQDPLDEFPSFKPFLPETCFSD